MKNVIITGAFRFPDKDAASQRVLGLGKAIKADGNNVIFCGWENEPRTKDKNSDGSFFYQGFEYFSMKELDIPTSNIIDKLYKFITKGSKTLRFIKYYITTHPVDTIIVYNSNSYFLYKLFKYCKKKNIKLIADCTEYYEGAHLPGGKYGIANLDNNIRIKIIYPKISNLILISSYLKDYYVNRNCKVIIVPPLIDLNEDKWKVKISNNTDYPLSIIYAGDPGKKDAILQIINALSIVNKNEINFKFNIIGVSYNKISNQFFNGKKIPNYICPLGRVPMEKVPEFYSQNSYSILIRENKRYANAGFPTKFVESFASGVPVIANLTSDLKLYLQEGKTGFILKDNSTEELITCLLKILDMHKCTYGDMVHNVHKISEDCFDFHNFIKLLNDYLK